MLQNSLNLAIPRHDVNHSVVLRRNNMPKTKTAARKIARKKGGRVKGEVVPPVAVKKLMDLLGGTEARRRIGVTETTMYRGIKAGSVSKVIEVAAQAVLEREESGAAFAERSDDDYEETGFLILELPLRYENKIAALAEKIAGAKVVK